MNEKVQVMEYINDKIKIDVNWGTGNPRNALKKSKKKKKNRSQQLVTSATKNNYFS